MAFDSDAPRRFRPTEGSDGIPASPPACVLAEVDAAFERMEQLRAAGREIHFAVDAMTRRLVVEVRTRSGEVLRTLSPSAALDFMTGGPH
jgi:hypothetical protein